MKRIETRPSQGAAVRVLAVSAGVLALLLLGGTIFGLLRRGVRPVSPPPEGTGSPPPEETGEESIFSSIGTIRIATADPDPETLIISVAFPYDRGDRPFAEELASRISWFKSATTEYLGGFTAEELAALDEEAVNAGLLDRYNSVLRLGRIKELYILDFMRL